MTPWIECNLPVHYRSELLPEYLPAPDPKDFGLIEPDYDDSLDIGEGAYWEFHADHSEWNNHPAMIEWEKASEDNKKVNAQTLANDAHKSFVGKGLLKPGVLMEVQKANGKIEQVLIGHADYNGSVCGDFAAFDINDVVVKYLVLWEGSNPSFVPNYDENGDELE